MAVTSQHTLTNLSPPVRSCTYCVSLEGFDWAVAAEPADVNAHVCAAGGKGSIVLPVHIESRGCGTGHRRRTPHLLVVHGSTDSGQLKEPSRSLR